MDEGCIKFNCEWIKDKPILTKKLIELNNCRNKLYTLGLVGSYNNGISFGNLSARLKKNTFIITGSATGNLELLDESHYSLVTKYNFMKNSLTCKGQIKASSESLSHAAIYECSPDINAVIHVHNIYLWEKFIDKLPTTKRGITYGTIEMADEIKRLFKESNVNYEKIILMGGHKEGIISFGNNAAEAENILLSKLKKCNN